MDIGEPTRILIFSLAYHPFIGGAELAVEKITDRLAPEPFEFHLVTLRFNAASPRYEKIGRVHVHRVGWGKRGASAAESFSPLFYLSKMLFVPSAALKGRALHRTHHFAGAWAMMSYMTLPIVLMRFIGIRLPYILTLQEGDTFTRTFGRAHIVAIRPLLRAGFRHAAVITAISTYLGHWARRMGYEGPLEIIPNGVDTERFMHSISPHDVDALKKELHKKEGDIFLITTSRLVEKNGVDIIIRALAYLPERVSLLILGEGPQEQQLQELARELGVAARVRFLGFVSHAMLPHYLHASDVFARPSRSEGMGSSFIEAMAAGLPVIATQEGGIADFLFDAERDPDREPTGFAVDVDAPDQLAAQVEKILSNEAAVQDIVVRAREMVRAKYDWGHIAEAMRRRAFHKLT